jgi:signal transduction histidine kinase
MSCALREKTFEPLRAAGDPQAAIFSELANGLHALVQPLTIVRGALGALSMSQGISPEHERYLQMSSAQVDRMCDLMSDLQTLLDATQFDAHSVDLDLSELIGPIIEDLHPVALQSGVQIAPMMPHDAIHAIADPARTEKALQASLKTAVSVASRGDVIRLDVLSRNGFVDLTVRNTNRHGKSLSSSDRLSLALVQAAIRSQHGVYECVEDPLRISLSLPLRDDPAEMCTEVILHYPAVQQLN